MFTYNEAKSLVKDSREGKRVNLDYADWDIISNILLNNDDKEDADYANWMSRRMYHIEEYNCDLL